MPRRKQKIELNEKSLERLLWEANEEANNLKNVANRNLEKLEKHLEKTTRGKREEDEISEKLTMLQPLISTQQSQLGRAIDTKMGVSKIVKEVVNAKIKTQVEPGSEDVNEAITRLTPELKKELNKLAENLSKE